jgi:mannobiose 2-epimerase
MLIKESLRGELEAELRRLVAAWFPRSVDTEYGGFLCNFDYRWKSAGSQPKMLEYQARQTIAAARSGAHSSDLADLREIATHGFRYLKDRMWDGNLGGWYRLLDRDGTPREASIQQYQSLLAWPCPFKPHHRWFCHHKTNRQFSR